MKRMKHFAALALALVLLASLLPTLSVPAEAASKMNPTINNGILTWQPLDGAATYNVNWYIDNWTSGVSSITGTRFDLQAAMDASRACYSGEYKIRVVAYRASGSYISEEQIGFNYHSTLPGLNSPAIWFDGTTIRWTTVDHAYQYAYHLRSSASPDSFNGSPFIKSGIIQETSADCSAKIVPDLYYMAEVEARSKDGDYKWSKRSYTKPVLGADLIAGFQNAPIQITVAPPLAGHHAATTGKTDDLSLYKVTYVTYNLLKDDGSEGLAMSSEDTFELGKTYRIWVRLTSASHFEFTDDTTAAINGISAVNHGVNMGGDAWFTVDMVAEKVPTCEVTVIPPMPGQNPVSTGDSADTSRFMVYRVNYAPVTGDGFGATMSESEVFAPNQVYRVFVVLWPKGDWGSFAEDVPVTINGIAATYYGALTGRGMYYVDMKCKNPFVDVHESDFFFNPVMWAVGNTVTAGTDETHFSPERTVMRCDSMVFFWAAQGRPAVQSVNNPFVDVKKKDWFYNAVLWAVKNHVTGGTDATHFSPKQTCSRSEILQFLYAAMNRPAYTISNPYSDVKKSHWYYDGAILAYENGLEHGENGKYNAKTPCTRGYVVTYLYRFITGKELAQ